MTFYRELVKPLVKEGISVRVIEGSGYFSGPRHSRIVEDVCIETLEIERLQKWEKKFSHLNQVPAFRRNISAAWAMWEQANLGEAFDVVEATDFGLLFVPPIMTNFASSVLQMHGSLGQLSKQDPLAGQELDGALSLAVETEFAVRARSVQSSAQANGQYWRTQTERDVLCIRPAWTRTDADAGPEPSKRLAVVGRVQRWKGPQTLCEALRLLGDRSPEVDWYGRDTSYGDANLTTSQWLTQEYSDIWGVKIRHMNPVSVDEVARIQAGALLNVVPSTWDVFNLATVEAMASGRPVICSSGAGASELIDHERNGFVFESGNAHALADSIDRAMSMMPERQWQIAAAASETISRELNPQMIARQRIEIYETLRQPQEMKPMPEWIGRLCSPADVPSGAEMTFLDHHPLRKIAKYAASRTVQRFRR